MDNVKLTKNDLLAAIEVDGLDYALAHWADWNNFEDQHFVDLYNAYMDARARIESYIHFTERNHSK